MKCAVFAGGLIENTDFIDSAELTAECGLIICADSGYRYAEKLGITPDIIMGDFDSYTGGFPDNTEIYRSIPEKDDTDTLLAVKTAILRGCDEIVLYGALGKRFDHTFANIQTLVYAFENGCAMSIIDADNEITVQGSGERHYRKRDGWYFSIFSLTDTALIKKYSGVKYPLEDYLLKSGFPIGVSNEIKADEAVLQIESGLVLVVRSEM
ncbi:MAG: thiamine diphosphokinase [Ruminococcus flavefaciens]|nr:thiamine diphosphokinase [Ruminococcus flavefaciens]MCM1229027.1 thiamine diphosphokinase [Ruminococcus flavefaciens]